VQPTGVRVSRCSRTAVAGGWRSERDAVQRPGYPAGVGLCGGPGAADAGQADAGQADAG